MKSFVVAIAVAILPAFAGTQSRTALARDVEGYAVATCLAAQADAALRRQGEGWASVIVQRGRGNPAFLKSVQAAVGVALSAGTIPVVREDGPRPTELALPIMFCSEIVDRPNVRRAVQLAIGSLRPAYRR